MSVSRFCTCGGTLSRIFGGNVTFICIICNKSPEKIMPNDSLISEIAKNNSSNTKYYDFIYNAKSDTAATVFNSPCRKCEYPVLHYVQIGEDMTPYYICPDKDCDFIIATAKY